jgi:hypothetical protein
LNSLITSLSADVQQMIAEEDKFHATVVHQAANGVHQVHRRRFAIDVVLQAGLITGFFKRSA